ncbi:MAG: hypothetical protein CUN56_06830 [Phototrophicales bacterium]|nr:MAG: hypothetical protein CUN56_06830 [Phototrophicales bacterium]RMG71473.1 MAG: hypothetical protein D6711_15275 [Chloroflexota bacterium]
MTTKQKTHNDLSHQFLEEDQIHILTFHRPSREATDTWFKIIGDYYQQITPNTPVKILSDYRLSGFPPLAYTMRKGRVWMKELPFHPPVKLAIVHNSDVIVPIFATLIQTLRLGHLTVKFFREDEPALTWLKTP